MSARHFPVRPDLEQLRHQAKDLLRAMRRGDPAALEELRAHHPNPPAAEGVKLADAQLVLARSYGVPSWPRIVHACKVIDAIWRDDVAALRELVARHPSLLHEMASGTRSYNWGPPMTYAANLGRDAIIDMLHQLGATDLSSAFDRAALQGQIDTARRLLAKGAVVARDAAMGPAETLDADGMALVLELGAPIGDQHGDPLAPVAMLLETYGRSPEGKHRCLELLVEHGVTLPDTPTMAVHRGRIDLLETLCEDDPDVVRRTYSHQEIYPPSLGCHADPTLALNGTPIAGGTLLHMCIDFDEMEIARWLIARGADVNARADVDDDGFGGHTALFGCVVSQPYRLRRQREASATRLLLDHGADVTVRASLRKELRGVDDETLHEYRDVSLLEWGERFHDQAWVNPVAVGLIRDRLARA
jgi:hypothetical protein